MHFLHIPEESGDALLLQAQMQHYCCPGCPLPCRKQIEIIKSFDLILDSEEAILFVLKYVEENKVILNSAYDSIGRDELKRFFCNDFYSIVINMIDNVEKLENITADEEYKHFLCDFYSGALATELIEVFHSRKPFDHEKLVRYLTATLKAALPAALKSNNISR